MFIDQHFHYDDKYKVEEYKEALDRIDISSALLVIHGYQSRWREQLFNIGNELQTPIGIEWDIDMDLTAHKLEQAKEYYNNIPFIYSTHHYRTQKEFNDILLHACKLGIHYITHPFSNHINKEYVRPDIMVDFLLICKDYNLKVEINNKYWREYPQWYEWLQEVLIHIPRDHLSFATDAHSPNKIGKYRKEYIEKFPEVICEDIHI